MYFSGLSIDIFPALKLVEAHTKWFQKKEFPEQKSTWMYPHFRISKDRIIYTFLMSGTSEVWFRRAAVRGGC